MIETQLIVIFTLCAVTILSITIPLVLSHLKEKREAEERKAERKAEYEARRNREEDLCVLLGNLVKADAAMDHIGSRGGNSEQRFTKLCELLGERLAKSD